MSNDIELLRQYIAERSENAFTELVRQHLNLVYSAALREMRGDAALAEDVSQAVFTELAGKARRLLGHPSLAGWLYTTVRHMAANLRRAEQRRRLRDDKAYRMNEPLADDPPDLSWQRIQPVLDDALHELNDADRSAVVLRFLEDRSMREIGATLGLNENAARMRVDRALDKLRSLLARRGITSTASGLAAALAVGVITPAPTALAATIATSALAGSAVTASTTLTFIKIMSAINLKTALIGALVITGVSVPVYQQSQLRRVESENAQLQTQTAELATLREEIGRLRKIGANQAELESLRKWQAQTQPELLRLRGMAGVARRAEAETTELRTQLARHQSESATNQMAGPMGDLMKNVMDQQVTNRVSRMTAMLNLTPDQARAATEILLRQGRAASAGIQQVFSGKFDKDAITKLGKENGNPEEQIKALLTPEQLAGYQNYKQDEAASNARLMANSELMQMQTSLGLTVEQQDQVFGVLYDSNLSQLTSTEKQTAASPAEQMQQSLERKTKLLENVLTPTQIETYRHQQEVQVKFLKDILSKMDNSSGAK